MSNGLKIALVVVAGMIVCCYLLAQWSPLEGVSIENVQAIRIEVSQGK
jgi:hypothetical protein